MRERIIIINGKQLEFKEVELYHGKKKINKKIAIENLLLLRPIIEKSKVRYGLFFGTLLGAIRENDIIEHDEDIDIYILAEDKDIFLKFIFEIDNVGLKLIRYTSDLISFMRRDEYIDIYFFKKKKYLLLPNIRKLGKRYQVRANYLDFPQRFSFLGEDFHIPNNHKKVLKKLYGKNWRTPIINYHAPANSYYARIINIIPNFLLNILRYVKTLL